MEIVDSKGVNKIQLYDAVGKKGESHSGVNGVLYEENGKYWFSELLRSQIQ